MATIDMKGLKALQATAGKAWTDWASANSYALAQHAGYKAALAAWKTVRDAFEAVRAKADGIISQLASDPDTDQSWFDPGIQSGPVWLRNNALSTLNILQAGRDALWADIAAHMQIAPADVALDPVAAAAAADAAAKTPPPVWHPGAGAWNPNAATPDAQDPAHPPADSPPVPEAGTPWGWIAAAAAAALLLARAVLR